MHISETASANTGLKPYLPFFVLFLQFCGITSLLRHPGLIGKALDLNLLCSLSTCVVLGTSCTVPDPQAQERWNSGLFGETDEIMYQELSSLMRLTNIILIIFD